MTSLASTNRYILLPPLWLLRFIYLEDYQQSASSFVSFTTSIWKIALKSRIPSPPPFDYRSKWCGGTSHWLKAQDEEASSICGVEAQAAGETAKGEEAPSMRWGGTSRWSRSSG
ncbi:uncharacterized protein N7458_006504 [Penicillium daleae]|uniref:Uncharacterized protein n=1 Tax=Penicillium daleae TaxID=63821 RepID=A0AAD6G2Y9_9EURO|nr:uncharacterized protein N7458_006504 [Penicillium daleae]KAJ5450055.1 hypothetical protein N7458_006504 [Penicillium daleae]